MAATSIVEAQSQAASIAELVGLPRWRSMDDFKLAELVCQGFPASAVRRAAERIDPDGRFLKPTDIVPKATLHRRLKDKKPLTKDESEKVYALARVFVEARRIYHEDADRVASFMLLPHPLLNDRRPFDLALESIAGAELVEKLLLQADAGVAV